MDSQHIDDTGIRMEELAWVMVIQWNPNYAKRLKGRPARLAHRRHYNQKGRTW